MTSRRTLEVGGGEFSESDISSVGSRSGGASSSEQEEEEDAELTEADIKDERDMVRQNPDNK